MFNSSSFYPGDKSTVVREATSTRPMIRLVEKDGLPAIVKDFSYNGFFYRNTAGRFLVWREARAYRLLSGLTGVPRLLEVADGPALVIEAVDGIAIKKAARQKKLTPAFFDTLTGLIDRIHERGLAHCDLKTAGNILVTPDGSPVIIDWAASISKKEFGFFPLTMIYRRFGRDDYQAIIKHRLRYYRRSGQVDRAGYLELKKKELYDTRSRTEKIIRAVRNKIRAFLQTIA